MVTTTATLPALEFRSAAGGILAQQPDRISTREPWKVVTERQPSQEEENGLEFAWIVCAHVKSNAIVLTNESQSVGIGAGQMSRVDSVRIATQKAAEAGAAAGLAQPPTCGAVLASDAFFPFADGLEAAIAARQAARKAKDFKESDRIRDQLLAKGIVLKDGPAGTTWEVKR